MSDIGRSRSARIAIGNHAHGHAPVFPGEDPEAYREDVSSLARALGAEGAPEIVVVESAVRNLWQARRVNHAQTCVVAAAVHRIQDEFDDGNDDEVQYLARCLAADPGSTVTKLMSSTRGCAYLIEQFTILGEWLTNRTSFEVSQRVHALHLGGHRPNDLFTDPVIMEFNRAYLGGLKGQGRFTAAMVASMLQHDRPRGMSAADFERRLERLVIDLPSQEEGHALLKEHVRGSIARLSERREVVRIREQFERDLAIRKAQVDLTNEGQMRSRYLASSESLVGEALRTLRLLIKERQKRESAGTSASDPPARKRKTQSDRP